MQFERAHQFKRNPSGGRPAANDAPRSGLVDPQIVSFFPSPAGRTCRVALIGGFRPRKCGIATFTTDIFEQFARHRPDMAIDMHVIDSPADPQEYPDVRSVVRAEAAQDYIATAARINEDAVDAVWLQHEFGIFGGDDGEMVLELVDRIAPPLVVTLHTVLEQPSERQHRIVDRLLKRALQVMVMSRHARDLLLERHEADPDQVTVIEHGAPDRPFGHGEAFREKAGLSGRNVLMTFGLLGPGKGLETVIDALPAIVARHPETVYRIVGATHPNLVAREGESYREKLMARACELGVERHLDWDNRFLELGELLDQLQACDIYLTPYPNLGQSTSGTLSYAVALGRAVVSTPYIHARELLGGGIGRLIEPGSSDAVAQAVTALLDDRAALADLQRSAWERGRETIWPQFTAASAAMIERALRRPPVPAPLRGTAGMAPKTALGGTARRISAPGISAPGISAVVSMSDATGMLQHAIGVVPDRRHGYCLDDNVRALMLMGVAHGMAPDQRRHWATVYASFIQHAWNPDQRRFRNFMNFDRTWCEDVGSQDSNGRALWALGHAIGHAPDEGLRHWARQWFDIVVEPVSELESPRTVAFAMLGACAALRAGHRSPAARDLFRRGARLLMRLLDNTRRPDWAWFETVLGYDNPRLPQALIEAAVIDERDDWLAAGIDTLRFISAHQVSAAGHFRAIGSETFHRPYAALPFDQQPLEAWAAIDAASSAFGATGDSAWRDHALLAYHWFLGGNDRAAVLADLATGRCRDGLTPQGFNENCGAESILAFQLSHYALQSLIRSDDRDHIPGDEFADTNRSAHYLAHSR